MLLPHRSSCWVVSVSRSDHRDHDSRRNGVDRPKRRGQRRPRTLSTARPSSYLPWSFRSCESRARTSLLGIFARLSGGSSSARTPLSSPSSASASSTETARRVGAHASSHSDEQRSPRTRLPATPSIGTGSSRAPSGRSLPRSRRLANSPCAECSPSFAWTSRPRSDSSTSPTTALLYATTRRSASGQSAPGQPAAAGSAAPVWTSSNPLAI